MAKRIALLLPSLVGGGAERSARFAAVRLQRAGYHVDMVVAVSKGALLDDRFVREHLVALGASNELLCLPAYLRYLKRASPDLVISYVHSANLISGLGGLFRPDIPFIVSIRNTLIKQPRDQWWVRRWLGFGPERWLYRRARFVQTISDAVEGQVARLFAVPEDRRWQTYNSAEDPDGRPPAPPSPETAAEIAALDPYLVSTGRLAGIKDFPLLIRAFAAAALPAEWSLVIVGEGPARGEIEALIAALGMGERVRLVGYHDPVAPWLAGARGYVYASRGEGFGRVIHEALLAGLPIAAINDPAVAEVLGNGSLGRLIARGDTDAMARAMEDIAGGTLGRPDPALLAAQLARFAPDAVAARYLAMVEAAIGAP